jgi:hypothetical protein
MKIIGCLSIVALLSLLGALGASAAGPASPRNVTFHLVERQIGSNFVDNPPRQGFNAAPLIGDQFMFTSDVQTKAGAHAGALNATCTITRGGPHGTGPCYGVFSFKGGQLVGIAALSFTNPTTVIAIVGGTGVYAGATGTVISTSRGENSPYTDDVFHLTLP